MSKPTSAKAGSQFRQGDTYFVPLGSKCSVDGFAVPDTIPETAVKAKNNIVAYGEVTGHSHALVGDFDLVVDGDKMYLRVKEKGATLTHQDHGHIALPGNTEWYVRNHQTEWTPQGLVNVRD